MSFKNYLACILLILSFTTKGQSIKLDYTTKTPVIKFNFRDLTLYTDTDAVFSIRDYSPYVSDYQYTSRVKDLIISSIKNDTATFKGPFIPFNDSVQNQIETHWRVWLTIRQLIIQNKVMIINSNGEKIKGIKIKNIRGKEKCLAGKVFINTETKEELFMYEYRYACTGWLWDY